MVVAGADVVGAVGVEVVGAGVVVGFDWPDDWPFWFEFPDWFEPPVPGCWSEAPLSLPVGDFEFVCLLPPLCLWLPGAGLTGLVTRIVSVPAAPRLWSVTWTLTL